MVMTKEKEKEGREKTKKEEQPHHVKASLPSRLGKNCLLALEKTQDKILKEYGKWNLRRVLLETQH